MTTTAPVFSFVETNLNFQKNWTKAAGSNYSDEIIDAYLSGKKQALEFQSRLAIEKLNENLGRCNDLTQLVCQHIREKGFQPLNAYLNIEDVFSFKVLIAVSEKDYFDEEFLPVLGFSYQKSFEARSPYFYLRFLFTYESENFNEESIIADGYYLKMK